jgi:hypothetical protein
VPEFDPKVMSVVNIHPTGQIYLMNEFSYRSLPPAKTHQPLHDQSDAAGDYHTPETTLDPRLTAATTRRRAIARVGRQAVLTRASESNRDSEACPIFFGL